MVRRLRFAEGLSQAATVMAVAFVLSALLLPTLAHVRAQSQQALCMSHLKQLGVAMRQYARDYDDMTVPAYLGKDYEGKNPKNTWCALLTPYLASSQAFYCPTGKRLPKGGYVGDYGVNEHVCFQRSRLTAVTRPASVMLMADRWDNPDGGAFGYLKCPACAYPEKGRSQADRPRIEPRHALGFNILFVDGHVAWKQPPVDVTGAVGWYGKPGGSPKSGFKAARKGVRSDDYWGHFRL